MPTLEVRPDSEDLLQHIAESVLKSRKIIVVTGAGISTNSGIPDFRSENGLYSLIQAQFDAASKLALAQREEDAEELFGTRSSPPPAKRRRTAYNVDNGPDACDPHDSSKTDIAEPPQQSAAVKESESTEPSGEDQIPRPLTARFPEGSPGAADGSSRRRRSASAGLDGQRVDAEHSTAPRLPRARSMSPSRSWRDCTNQPVSWTTPMTKRAVPNPCRRPALPLTSSPPSSPPERSSRPTPLSARFKSSVRTPLRFPKGPAGFNSSPLSSPPPVLFDPYQGPSSATSHQGSSDAGSAASSETDETPPSSVPSLVSQTSNPSRASLPNLKGRDLFDVSIWSDPVRTSVFYTFTTTLRQKSRDVEPTTSHHFISHLKSRGKLVRCYTQNIDQIEEKVGLSTSLQQGPGSRGRFSRRSTGGFAAAPTEGPDGKIANAREPGNGGVECVFLHGSLQSLRCFLCGQICEWDEGGRSLETLSGRQPECPHCVGATTARQERGKRALGVGKLRPDIVLYGEEHPNAHLIDPLVKHDLALYPDFLLILGTSLKVHGLKVIVREFARTVHCKGGKVVFVNFTKPPESSWGDIIDYWVQWDCDAWVSDLQARIPLLWMPPGTKMPNTKRKRESSGAELSSKRTSILKQESTLVSEDSAVSNAESSVVERPAPKARTKKMAERSKTAEKGGKSRTEADGTERAKAESTEQPPKAPARPMSQREDKTNGAYLTWQIMRDLRRLSGEISEVKMFSSPIRREPMPQAVSINAPVLQTLPCPPAMPRGLPSGKPPRKSLPGGRKIIKKENEAPKAARHSLPALLPAALPPVLSTPKAQKQRKNGRGWVYVTDDDPQAQAVQMRQQMNAGLRMDGVSPDDQSILSAVKSNPRVRKRKTIDGVEVGLPSTPQRPSPASRRLAVKTPNTFKTMPPSNKTLPPPASRAMVPQAAAQNKENQGGLSKKILSDLTRAPMHSLTLAPIRSPPCDPLSAQDISPAKLAPLEPLSPPAGPLASIAPNVAAQTAQQQMRDLAFQYCDPLTFHFASPPWTPEDQLKQEQAAEALNGLRAGVV